MRQNEQSILRFDVEDASICLSSATKNLRIIRDEISQNLFAMERDRIFLGTGHLMDCCDAMFTTIRELDRIQEELDAIVQTAYTKGD